MKYHNSQVRYVFPIEKNVSRVMGQNSLIPQENNRVKFSLVRDKVANLETANWVPAGIKQYVVCSFFFSIFGPGGITKHLRWLDRIFE